MRKTRFHSWRWLCARPCQRRCSPSALKSGDKAGVTDDDTDLGAFEVPEF